MLTSVPAPTPTATIVQRVPPAGGTPSSPVPTPTATTLWIRVGATTIYNHTSTTTDASGPDLKPLVDVAIKLWQPTLHVVAFDQTPSTYAKIVESLWDFTPFDETFGGPNYTCSLCFNATTQEEWLSTQLLLHPFTATPHLPPQAQIYSTAVDLTNFSGADVAMSLGLNDVPSFSPNRASFLAGYASGTDPTLTQYSDGYLVYESRLDRNFRIAFSQAITNHVPVTTSGMPPMRGSDSVITLEQKPVWWQVPTSPENWNYDHGGWHTKSLVQYGTHAMADGQTENFLEAYGRKSCPEACGDDRYSPWSFLVPGVTGNYTIRSAYVARGANFMPADAGAPDALVGLHGFAGDFALFPRSIVHLDNRLPMLVAAAGWAYGDRFPRIANTAGIALVPLKFWNTLDSPSRVSGLTANISASRGVVAASLASAAAGATPIADTLGGTDLISQSAVEFDVMYAQGIFKADGHPDRGGNYLRNWSIDLGYAISTDPDCNVTGAARPCLSVPHKNLVLNTWAKGDAGFVSLAIGPAIIASGGDFSANNPFGQVPRHIGDFVNKTSWSLLGDLQLPLPKNWGQCGSLVASASNSIPPPDVLNALGTALNIATFLEMVPEDQGKRSMAFFIGASHTIANQSPPTFATPSTFAVTNYVSTIQYSAKVVIGSTMLPFRASSKCISPKV